MLFEMSGNTGQAATGSSPALGGLCTEKPCLESGKNMRLGRLNLRLILSDFYQHPCVQWFLLTPEAPARW